MIYNLLHEYNLRGYSFEYISRIILRRTNNNNFIFQLSNFDSIDELLNKYRLKVTEHHEAFIEFMRQEWNRFDLIEFELNSVNETREILNIIVYDVKSKNNTVERNYFEFCESNFKFMKRCSKFNIMTKIISIVLFENWKFSFNVFDFEKVPKRIYSRANNTQFTLL